MEAHSVDIPDRYSIEGLLGEGAAATTYRAYDGVLDRRVTLKVLRRPDGDDDAVTARFAREARAAAAVDHPNVVDVYDYGSHQGSLHLVLQYVPGRNLKQLLAETGPLPARDAVRIVDQVLAGLGAIHAAGLVHRDVKPQNVIVGDDGVARVTDFGIAVAPTDTRLTTHGAVWGTPAYMAPEQAGGDAVSPRTDLYAVGVMLFEMLTGRLPFAADNAIAVALAHIHNPPPSWRQFAPRADVPPAVEAAMLRALAKNPADRFGDAAAMTAALNGPAPTVVASDPTVQLRLDRVGGPTVPFAPAERRAGRRRPPWGRIAAVVAAALLLSAAVARFVPAFGPGSDGGAPSPTALGAVLAAAGPSPTTTLAPTPRIRTTVTPAPAAAAVPSRTPRSAPSATSAPTQIPTPTERPAPTETPTPTERPAPTETPAPTATSVPKPTDIPPTAAPSDSGGAPTIAPAFQGSADVPAVSAATLDVAAADWQGAYMGDQSWYGRPWVAVYGSQSAYPVASIPFRLDAPPTGGAVLAIDGLDDENQGNVPIAVAVNGTTIYSGPSPFASWNGAGQGESANWTTVKFTIPPGVLVTGVNRIDVSNQAPSANFGLAPYVLLGSAHLSAAG